MSPCPTTRRLSDRLEAGPCKRLRPSGLRSGPISCTRPGLGIAAASASSAVSHSLSVPSAPPVARRVPSGLKAMASMSPECPLKVWTFRPVAVSQHLRDPFDAPRRQAFAVRAEGQAVAVIWIRTARRPRARAWPRPRCGYPCPRSGQTIAVRAEDRVHHRCRRRGICKRMPRDPSPRRTP